MGQHRIWWRFHFKYNSGRKLEQILKISPSLFQIFSSILIGIKISRCPNQKKIYEQQNKRRIKNSASGTIKEANTMATCTICKQTIRMVKKNEQAKAHVENKHSKSTFEQCFPGFTCG